MSQTSTPVDPDGLLEYSVVYTDRALNHMSKTFQEVMREISRTLKQVYQASLVAMMAGSDFIKTSTGKESVNATLEVSLVREHRDYHWRRDGEFHGWRFVPVSFGDQARRTSRSRR